MKNKAKHIFTPVRVLIGLIFICAFLIAVSFFSDRLVSPLRSAVSQVVIPLQRGMNSLGGGIVGGVEKSRDINQLQAQNEELRQRIFELENENMILSEDTRDLEQLRELYKLDRVFSEYPKTGASIIGTASQNWNSAVIIDKGSDHGISVDMNVISGEGLVGIVTEVHNNYSIVTTIIGDNSYVSAMDESSADMCTAKGDLSLMDTGRIRLERFKDTAKVSDGDRIVTSPISSKYLPGILIGYASDVDVDGNALTQSGELIPAVDFEHLRKVLVITQLKESSLKES